MTDDIRLNELLDRWEDMRERGTTPSLEELCGDSPELVNELRRRIAALGHLDAMLGNWDGPTASWSDTGTQAAPTPPVILPAVSPYVDLQFHMRGNLGEVYRARDGVLKRTVAVKIIQAQRAGSPESCQRFERESAITGRLEHPGVAPVHASGHCEDGRPYYVMRFIEGATLGEAVRHYHAADAPGNASGERVLAYRDLLNRFIQACNTIEYAHGRGVLHRDIKPSNVMFGPYGETLVVDWGLAKVLGDRDGEPRDLSGSSSPDLTAAGSALGTLAFMAPEQLDGALDSIGPVSDVYSLGATLYCILTGRAPFMGDDLAAVRDQVRWGQFPSPREVRRDVPPALQAICLKAMALRSEERYSSAGLLAGDVQKWLADELVSVYREPLSTRVGRWGRKHREWVRAGAAFLIVLAALTAAFAVAQTRSARRLLRENRKANQSLSDFCLERGQSLALGGDPGGLLWMGRALAVAPTDDADRQTAIRLNISSWARWNCALDAFLPAAPTGCMAFSPDGTVVVTGSADNTARLWSTKDGSPLGCPMVHPAIVRHVAFSPNGKTLLTGGKDGIARLWDVERCTEIGHSISYRQGDYQPELTSVAFSPDGLAILTVYGRTAIAQLWAIANGRPIGARMELQSKLIGNNVGAFFSRDGKTILTATDSIVQLWSTHDGKPLGHALSREQNAAITNAAITKVALSPDGKTVLTGHQQEPMARLWNASNGQPIGKPMVHNGRGVWAVAFSPDGKTAVTGGDDQTARLWSTADASTIGKPMVHGDAVRSVAFSPDGRMVATGCDDGTGRLWDSASGSPFALPMLHGAEVRQVEFSPLGNTIATRCSDGTIRLWSVAAGPTIGRPLIHDSPVADVTFSPDGKTVLSECYEGFSRLWSADQQKGDWVLKAKWMVEASAISSNGSPVTVWNEGGSRGWITADGKPAELFGALIGGASDLYRAVFRPDGKAILFGGNKSARFWNIADGKPIGPPMMHDDAIVAVAFSPDGRTALTGSGDSKARLWSAADGTLLGQPMKHRDMVKSVAFSPDGKIAVTGSYDNSARLWSLPEGTPVGRPMLHDDRVSTAAFSPDGKTVLTASYDKTARLWNSSDGLPAGNPMVHDAPVLAAAFSHDGKMIVTGSEDKTARLWRAAAGTPSGYPMVHKHEVVKVAFSPDGLVVVTASTDKTARLWNARNGTSIGAPMEHDGEVVGVAFSPRGEMIATGSLDKAVRIWAVPSIAAGTADQVKLWAEVTVGMELLDGTGTRRVLDVRTWQERRRRLAGPSG